MPNFLCHKNDAPHLRYLAIREPMAVQDGLPGIEPGEKKDLPFQTLGMNEREYKIFGIVTNRTMEGEALIHWHRERCGQSEKIHHIEKTEFAGGQFPSGKFGANAAWWQMMVLSVNLNNVMKQHAFPEELKTKGMNQAAEIDFKIIKKYHPGYALGQILKNSAKRRQPPA